MTLKNRDPYRGLPPPITKLTMEQDLKMRLIEDKLNSGNVDTKDLITVFLALQRQNFVLANSMINLVKNWPNEEIIFIHSGEGIPKEIQPKK